MILTIKQTKALRYLQDEITSEVLFGGGAGGGKTTLGCYWAAKMCFKYPGSRWLVGRSKLKTLKETTLVTLFDVLKKQDIPKQAFTYNQQAGHITFLNDSQILLKDLFYYPADPDFDELGSLEINGAYIDECSQVTVKAKNIVKSRIGRWNTDVFTFLPKLLMTSNPAKGWLYNEFYKPHVDNKLDNDKQFIHALYSDNPNLPNHYINNLDGLDSVSRARLKLGDWEYDSDPSQLINYESIIDCYTNDFVLKGEKYITADIARFGADKTVIGVWSGMRCEDIVVLLTSSIPESVKAIETLRRKNQIPLSKVIVDEQGVGGGVKDVLNCEGFIANKRATKGNFNNLKSQCFFKLAELINNNKIFISCREDYKTLITQELEVIKSDNLDKDGKLAVIQKDKMKEILGRSPDFADMLMMRMYFYVVIKNYF